MRESVQDQAVQTLTCLGLNTSQAKVYLALVRNGTSTAEEISKFSGVNRQEIYRIMPKLQNVGLAAKTLSLPTRWEPTPIEDGLSFLLEQRDKQTSELQTKATMIVNKIKENNKGTELPKEEPQFVMMPGKNAHIKWLKKKFEKSNTINGIFTWSDQKIVSFFFKDAIKSDLNKGGKIRQIVYLSENEKTIYKNEEPFKNNPRFQTLVVFTPPLVLGGVVDMKEVIIATTKDDPIRKGEKVLWSNSPILVSLFLNYFETLWKKALKHKNEEN